MSETGQAPTNPEGFPWGDNNPTRVQRIVFALLIAALAGGGLAFHLKYADLYRTDFSQLKFGAEAMLRGADPYKLVGMGQVFESKWPVMYPGTAYVAATSLDHSGISPCRSGPRNARHRGTGQKGEYPTDAAWRGT